MTVKIQEQIVQELVSLAPAGWEAITVNIEIDKIDGDLVISPDSEYLLMTKEMN